MRYLLSKDGKMRATINLSIRLTKEETIDAKKLHAAFLESSKSDTSFRAYLGIILRQAIHDEVYGLDPELTCDYSMDHSCEN